MALNIVSSGDFKPFVKYNAKAGRWFTKKDDQEVEVKDPVFVIDFANIQTGWFLFLEGQAPNVALDPSLTQAAAKPSDAHKRGFKVDVYSNALFGGVVEFSAASMHTCNAINDLYIQYEAGLAQNPGKLPVVEFKGTEAMKDKFGTNYKPLFAIQKWIDRPSAFGETKASQPAQQQPAQTTAAPAAQSSASEF